MIFYSATFVFLSGLSRFLFLSQQLCSELANTCTTSLINCQSQFSFCRLKHAHAQHFHMCTTLMVQFFFLNYYYYIRVKLSFTQMYKNRKYALKKSNATQGNKVNIRQANIVNDYSETQTWSLIIQSENDPLHFEPCDPVKVTVFLDPDIFWWWCWWGGGWGVSVHLTEGDVTLGDTLIFNTVNFSTLLLKRKACRRGVNFSSMWGVHRQGKDH